MESLLALCAPQPEPAEAAVSVHGNLISRAMLDRMEEAEREQSGFGSQCWHELVKTEEDGSALARRNSKESRSGSRRTSWESLLGAQGLSRRSSKGFQESLSRQNSGSPELPGRRSSKDSHVTSLEGLLAS